MITTEITRDPFTGLPNLFELLESAPLLTYGSPGTVIAADIDHLNNINENYGRQSGDRCIKILADLLRAIVVSCSDSVPATAFRTGGDEFILILPNFDKNSAENLANDLRKQFRSLAIKQGVLGTGLHTVTIPYNEKGISAHQLIKAVRLGLADGNTLNPPARLPKWADQLIDNMIDRVCETLNLLHYTRFLALHDEISGLPNHRAAEMFIADALQNYHLNKKPFSLLFIDGDNLKQYNNLGYQQGNQMIRNLATVISNSLHHNDLIARWLSGDEFIVVLPNTECSHAFQVGERLRAAVEKATSDWIFPVTISIGVANCPENGTTIETLLAKAESAVTFAKRAGKNQVS
ncbi:MAG TPA: GGDEF domain-containing protein [Bacillota bacterium]|nr:GGDEF domain-containing protein [Bacillota bacterium]